MERSIDDRLNGEPEPETVEVIEAPAPEAEAEQSGQPRVPKGEEGAGRFAPKETGVETPPAAEPVAEPVPPTEQTDRLPRDVYEPLKAVREENRELKRQIDAIQRQVYAQPAPQPTPQPQVDFWDDPHGYMSQQFSSFGEQLLQQWEHKQQVTRINSSEEAARSKYADYQDAYDAFADAVQANPRLAVELAQSSDPGEFAYSKGKAALAIQNVGSLDALKAQIRAEMEAEARAAIASAQRPVLPSTTAADGSIGGRSGPAWAGPTPLGKILS